MLVAPATLRHLKAWRASLAVLGVALMGSAVVYWTLHEASKRADRRINGIVCVTIPYIKGQRARNLFVATHDTSAARRASARQAVQGADLFLAGLVPIPVHFNCAPLLKKLAEEKAERDKKEAPHGP